MGNRIQLQTLFENLLGTRNVYFQPPESMKISYPCIIYSYDAAITIFADDKPYNHKLRYQVIIVDANPDSQIMDKIASLPMCVFNRHYVSDNLHHYIYNLYY